MQVGSIPAEERAKIKGIIDAGLTDKTVISTDMFDVVQKVVFKEMFYNTFQRFVVAPEYSQMHADIKNAYNKVGCVCVWGGGGGISAVGSGGPTSTLWTWGRES